MKKVIFTLLVAAAMVACTDDETQTAPVYQGETTMVYVDAAAGDYDFKITASGAWSASAVNSATRNWIDIKGDAEGKGDATLKLHYRANNSFVREGRIAVQLADAHVADTIVIRQHGKTPHIGFQNEVTSIYPVGGDVVINIDTNLTGSWYERITVESVAGESGTATEWISAPSILEEEVAVSCSIDRYQIDNPEEMTDTPREGQLRLRYTDDWGTEYTALCTISQLPMSTPEPKTFSEIRALATAEGTLLDKNYTIEGIVVSDPESENVAGNTQTGAKAIDFTTNSRTVYVESTDGSSGLMFELESAEDNVFKRWSHVTLSLNTTTIQRLDNPERYVVKGLTPNLLFGNDPGTVETAPAKEKYISELTADDLYTYVTLKDCEFPVHNGSYTPVNEGYGYLFNAKNIDKYPLAVRDLKGGSLFCYNNFRAPWRRDGNDVPKGTGKLSGVIVNEPFYQFEEDGNIGDFQIRPITQDDIAIPMEAARSKSRVLAEWSTMPAEGFVNAKMEASAGRGELSHEYGKYYGSYTNPTSQYLVNGFSGMGPYDGTLNNNDGKGIVAAASVRYPYWWDTTNNCGVGWLVSVSTSGISAQHIALVFRGVNTTVGAPRYWAVEWSEHGQKNGEWQRVGEYTLPDLVGWNKEVIFAMAGEKNFTMELPAEILGKEKVYIRLIPTVNKAGIEKSGSNPGSYDGGTIGVKWSQIGYLGIQYND